jgi:transcriptional regulator with XRE-family HTH domain
MIGARQIKAARALAGLSQRDVATRAGIGIATMRRIEAAIDEVIGSAQTLSRIQKALESEGVRFIDQDDQGGPGVRLRKPLPSKRMKT